MGNCGGYATPGKHDSPSRNALPCYPSTVVYGHAASRGLDIKRWTVGLDSGCVSYFHRHHVLITELHSRRSMAIVFQP